MEAFHLGKTSGPLIGDKLPPISRGEWHLHALQQQNRLTTTASFWLPPSGESHRVSCNPIAICAHSLGLCRKTKKTRRWECGGGLALGRLFQNVDGDTHGYTTFCCFVLINAFLLILYCVNDKQSHRQQSLIKYYRWMQ